MDNRPQFSYISFVLATVCVCNRFEHGHVVAAVAVIDLSMGTDVFGFLVWIQSAFKAHT